MLQKRYLLKLTEHSELNTKITLKTWSFHTRRQDSVTGGGGTGSLFMLIGVGHGAREIPSKHCIVGPMLARCSCQHLSNSDQRCSQCWGDAVLHQSPAFSQHWHSAAGRHRNLRRANNGGIMFSTSARSWQTAANQHRNCSYPTLDCKLLRTTSDPASRQQWRNNVANVGKVVKLQLAYIGTCVAPTVAE